MKWLTCNILNRNNSSLEFPRSVRTTLRSKVNFSQLHLNPLHFSLLTHSTPTLALWVKNVSTSLYKSAQVCKTRVSQRQGIYSSYFKCHIIGDNGVQRIKFFFKSVQDKKKYIRNIFRIFVWLFKFYFWGVWDKKLN